MMSVTLFTLLYVFYNQPVSARFSVILMQHFIC